MDYQAIISGLVIGFSIAAPVGPIGVLCIRRTLAQGRVSGLVSGLGAATADAVYGCVAAFGVTFVSNLLIGQLFWLRFFGGLFLCVLGTRTLLSKPSEQACPEKSKDLIGSYGSTFLLTLMNPLTILAFAGIFASLGLGSAFVDSGSAVLLVLSVFAGSALWWLVLSGAVSMLKTKLTIDHLRWINRFSGAIVIGFGVVALVSIVF